MQNPYIDQRSLNEFNEEIQRVGFLTDSLLAETPYLPVFGLNLAFGWPLPVELKQAYQKLADALAVLYPYVYLYPYRQTHVTVATLINFKRCINHPEEIDSLRGLIPDIEALISSLVSGEGGMGIKAFHIDVGPPVLSSRAALLPIANGTGEVFHLRNLLREKLKLGNASNDPADILMKHVNIPGLIHSTILRFIQRPPDQTAFINQFNSISGASRFGHAKIKEILLTEETRPYMQEGKIIHRFKLSD